MVELNPPSTSSGRAVLIQSAAARHNLPPVLIGALIEQESSGNPWAWNPEPRYRYLWDVSRNRAFRTLSLAEIGSKVPPLDFSCLAGDRDQEWWAQHASWGLMQVMGAVARECGYQARYLTELLAPEDNVEYGCRHLVHLVARFFSRWSWAGVIAAYNAGSPRLAPNGSMFVNQAYVDGVFARTKGALK